MTLARDVAKELEKRARRRKIIILAVVVAAMALMLSYLQCGSGFGFGGGAGAGAGGKGSAKQAVDDPKAKRCTVRLDAGGMKLEGKKATQDEIVAACKKAGRADVVVTGDARQGDWDALRAALDEAGIPHGTP